MGALLVTNLSSHLEIIRGLEETASDWQARLSNFPSSERIEVVEISPTDYSEIFHAATPLDQNAFSKLLDAISMADPAVIAVAIDTSSLDVTPATYHGNSLVVWARSASFSHIKKALEIRPLAHQRTPESWGVAVFKPDADDVVRTYTRFVKTTDNIPPLEKYTPSFGWQIVGAWRRLSQPGQPDDEPRTIHFSMVAKNKPGAAEKPSTTDAGKPFTAAAIFAMAAAPSWRGSLRGKIVLVGGAYDGNSEVDTPIGWMTATALWRQIVQTEMRGGGERPPPGWLLIIASILSGFLLWGLRMRRPNPRGLLLGLICLPLLALACSFVSFRSWVRWAYFLPFLFAIWLFQIYEALKSSAAQVVDEAAHGGGDSSGSE